MAPKKNKNTGGSSGGGGGGKATSMETQSDKQLWAALRQVDDESLQSLLFDAVQDAGTGGVHLVVKPTAKALVNRLSAKKLLPLCYAVADRLPTSMITMLLDAGADVNKAEEAKGANTALHHACYAEDEELVQLLLSCGANPQVQNANGETALHILAVAHAPRLLTTVLDSVAGQSTTANESEADGNDTTAQHHVSAPRGRPVRLSPLTLLAAAASTDGSTPLHVALENSLEAVEAMLGCMESASSGASAPQLRAILAAPTTTNGETPLHLVHALTQVTNDFPAVVRVWQRLVHLGADPAALNAEAQTPLMALLDKGELTPCRVEDMRTMLDAVDGTTLDRLLTLTDKRGLAAVHVAVGRHHTAALSAIRSYLLDRASTMNVAEVATRWLGCPTREGVRVVELLATQDVPAEMLALFEQLELIDKAEFSSLREAHQQGVQERAEAEARAKEEEEKEAESNEEPEETAAQASAQERRLPERSGGGGGGMSRVQQARKARAVAASAGGAGHRQGQKHGAKGGELGNSASGSRFSVSTPMLVVCGLIIISVVVMAFASTGNNDDEL